MLIILGSRKVILGTGKGKIVRMGNESKRKYFTKVCDKKRTRINVGDCTCTTTVCNCIFALTGLHLLLQSTQLFYRSWQKLSATR